MGEYAEMMLDGTCCAQCGEYLDDDDADGIPRYCCAACEPAGFRTPAPKTARTVKIKTIKCPLCEKMFAEPNALGQHVSMKHGKLEPPCES